MYARGRPRIRSGFTLIELVIAIAILAVLAAIALPRFASLRTEAHRSNVAGVAAGFRTAVALVHSTYAARRLTGAQDNLAGFGANDIDVNTAGYPTDTANQNTINAARCARVWTGILSSPPSVGTAVGTNPDYLATASGQTCTFAYRRDSSTARSLVYNALTGQVTLTNP